MNKQVSKGFTIIEALLLLVCIGLVLLAIKWGMSWKPAPPPKCELPIAIGKSVSVGSGDWGGYYGVIVGKIDTKSTCKYSLRLPQNQDLYRDIYIQVKPDNVTEVKL